MPNDTLQNPNAGNANPQRKTINHVIFLGAGASASSGYPLANKLRLRLASEQQILKEFRCNESTDEAEKVISSYFKVCAGSIESFRHGCFGTVDEFAYLASEKFPTSVVEMKQMTRLALSIHNPELRFEKSEYYQFVQRLFDANFLEKLRCNITIITYNYDSFLEYLILKAQLIRNRLAGKQEHYTSGWSAL